jgi:hypothetical protein
VGFLALPPTHFLKATDFTIFIVKFKFLCRDRVKICPHFFHVINETKLKARCRLRAEPLDTTTKSYEQSLSPASNSDAGEQSLRPREQFLRPISPISSLYVPQVRPATRCLSVLELLVSRTQFKMPEAAKVRPMAAKGII